MAGGILISQNVGVSMSTWFFDYVSELIRQRLSDRISKAALATIYDGKESCLSFIDLNQQPAEVFNNFYAATLEARANDSKLAAEALWDDILRKMRADPRWREGQPG